ncbi:MAG: ATP-binding protein [Candidatus Omnitrophica bacterium]|nr:ATP-binding protein [Candidatus Omnitrophota bacterium]MCM8776672.1 ATP-binding protein [Candidatus Omnitrophota bacterium]
MNEIIMVLVITVTFFLAVFFYLKTKQLINLSEDISRKYGSLSEYNKELKNRIEYIMNSFSSPALIIDRNGIISFANPEMKKLTGSSEMEKHNYLEFFKEPEFINAVQTVHKDSRPIEKEFSLNGHNFLAFFYPLGEEGDIFVSCRDITSEKELTRIKQELVTNMSHELKTPLTAIKGYVETLQEEIPPELKDYLAIIKKHTDRLINIVNDILSLSEIEETKKIELVPINIKEVVEEAVKMFTGKITDKNLSLKIDMDDDLVISGDKFRIEEMFINLIDNAVRYTDKGGIVIKGFKEKNNVVISIKDTGIGIPERSIPRIFERFYVVDRSRSKETGGTGLGLSIVKHIVMLHKGNIDVKSHIGIGTEVLITLPL